MLSKFSAKPSKKSAKSKKRVKSAAEVATEKRAKTMTALQEKNWMTSAKFTTSFVKAAPAGLTSVQRTVLNSTASEVKVADFDGDGLAALLAHIPDYELRRALQVAAHSRPNALRRVLHQLRVGNSALNFFKSDPVLAWDNLHQRAPQRIKAGCARWDAQTNTETARRLFLQQTLQLLFNPTFAPQEGSSGHKGFKGHRLPCFWLGMFTRVTVAPVAPVAAGASEPPPLLIDRFTQQDCSAALFEVQLIQGNSNSIVGKITPTACLDDFEMVYPLDGARLRRDFGGAKVRFVLCRKSTVIVGSGRYLDEIEGFDAVYRAKGTVADILGVVLPSASAISLTEYIPGFLAPVLSVIFGYLTNNPLH